jgi:DNA repair exonuclease SbcCD ATPase subunit
MANEINIGINTTSDLSGLNQVDESVKSLKTQLKEAQANVAALSEKFGATSKEAVEAAKSAAILKDKIGDSKALTDAFNPDAKFKAVSASLAGVAGGFSAVQGAMGLFGEESKDVEKAILKVQSAMALASGIQAIGESIDSFKQMKAVAVNAFNAIKGAIGASGIGLLVVALGTIYAYWDDIKAAVSGVSAEQKKLNKSAEDNLKTQKSKLDTINAQDATMKLQGKSEKEILKIKLAQTNQVITASEVQLKNNIATTKAQVEASKRNKEILKGTLEFLTAPLALLLDGVDAVGKALGKNFGLKEGLYGGIAKLVFNPDEIQKEADITNKALEKELITLKNTRDSLTLQIRDVDKKASDEQQKKREEQQKKREEKQKEEDEKAKERAKTSTELLKEEIKATEDLLANTEVKKENLRHERQLKEIEEKTIQKDKKKAIDIEEYNHSLRLAEAKINDQKALDEAFNKLKEDEYNKSVEFMNIEDAGYENDLQKKLAHYEHLLTIQKDYGKSTIEIDQQIAETKKQISEQEIANKKSNIEAIGSMAQTAADIGSFIADRIAGENVQDKERKKTAVRVGAASSIAGVIAQTAQANAGFLANPASVSTLGLAAAAPIAASIASSTIAIANILNEKNKAIREIDDAGGAEAAKPSGSKFATGGLVTGMGTSTSDSIIANLSNGESVINAKSTAMFGNLLSNINQAGGGVAFGNQNNANPIFKTYVVASEMTSQIEANLKLKQIARL